MYQLQNERVLPSMLIIIYLGSKYTTSYHKIDLVSAATNVQTPACNEETYMLTPFN